MQLRTTSFWYALPLSFALVAVAACGGESSPDPSPGDTGTSDSQTGGDVDTDGGAGEDDANVDAGPVCVDEDFDGYGANCSLGTDCNDQNPDVNPRAEEACGDRLDNNCNGEVDEGCICQEGVTESCYEGDPELEGVGACSIGFRVCVDQEFTECNHGLPSDEICDFIDNDCDGEVDEEVANACGGCGPVPLEVCGDLLDNDCNGLIDDVEGCGCGGRTNQPCYSGPPETLGFGVCRGGVSVCEDDVITMCLGEVLPGEEICDGLDNNCDGRVDEGLANSCGVCGAEDPVEVCDGVDNDCDGEIDEGLTNACGTCSSIEAPEVCGDGLDNNCDGFIDETCSCLDGDEACWPGRPEDRGIGQCQDGVRACDATGEFWGPCNDFVLPAAEVCDGLDNDCDGLVDVGPDGCSVCGLDFEICDGIDNDCDGLVDEFLRNPCGQCIADVEPEEECGPLCCDGFDNDCDGFTDEGLVNSCGECDSPCERVSWGIDERDWGEGDTNGLDIARSGALRLGSGLSGLPYLWIANSGEATVSRVNTDTVAEDGRFPVGQSPSRTAVDFDGNVFVANRAFNAQGTVTRVDVEDCTSDDCVRYTAPLGPNNAVPRGVAVDADGFPWLGTYNDQTLRRIDPATGLVLESHFVGVRVYGIAIDSEGILWFVNLNIPEYSGGQLGAFDTTAGEILGTWEIPGCSNPYGIAVDRFGSVWMGNFTCNTLVRFDRETESFTTYSHPMLDRTRGVAVDADGKVWVASYGTNLVGKFDPLVGDFVGVYPVCEGPIGIGISNDNHVWVPCYGSDNVYRLAPDGTFAGSVNVGRNPYSYSDLTGFQLRNFTARRGTWNVSYDCGVPGCIYDEIDWDAEEPPETEVLVQARVSDDGVSWSPWAGPFISTPADLSGLPPAQYIEIDVQLRTSNPDTTPFVNNVDLYWSRP